jgi:hypothetical protein
MPEVSLGGSKNEMVAAILSFDEQKPPEFYIMNSFPYSQKKWL